MLGVLGQARQRDLVAEVGALDLDAVDDGRAGPALRGAQDDGRPLVPHPGARPVAAPRLGLDRPDRVVGGAQGGQQRREDLARVVAGDGHGVPALAAQVGLHVLVARAAEHRGAGDLVAVEVEDRQHRPVAAGVEEGGQPPRRGQRTGLGLAVADDAGDDEVGVVERRTRRVGERVAELAALVDAPRRLHADVAGHPARRRELAEQRADAVGVVGDVRVDLGVGALEPGGRDERGPPVPRPGDVDPVARRARGSPG